MQHCFHAAMWCGAADRCAAQQVLDITLQHACCVATAVSLGCIVAVAGSSKRVQGPHQGAVHLRCLQGSAAGWHRWPRGHKQQQATCAGEAPGDPLLTRMAATHGGHTCKSCFQSKPAGTPCWPASCDGLHPVCCACHIVLRAAAPAPQQQQWLTRPRHGGRVSHLGGAAQPGPQLGAATGRAASHLTTADSTRQPCASSSSRSGPQQPQHRLPAAAGCSQQWPAPDRVA